MIIYMILPYSQMLFYLRGYWFYYLSSHTNSSKIMKLVDAFYISPYVKQMETQIQTAFNRMYNLHVYKYFSWFQFFRNGLFNAILPHS